MNRRWFRLLAFSMLVIGGAYLYASFTTAPEYADRDAIEASASVPFEERDPVAGQRPNTTVISAPTSFTENAEALYAIAPDGRLLYFDTSQSYFDVDPSRVGDRTVLTTGWVDHDCAGTCTHNRVERINLTTGERERIHEGMTDASRNSNWHDVDRAGDNEYLIAAIKPDAVRRVNISADTVEWGWRAQSEFSTAEAGPYPKDWTHINDIERLPDGRVMVSLRNQDQVLFIHPDRGVQPNWTLGCDDCFNTLYEQHNPDYIPASRGGPAVLVADSENDRVIEYQRVNGSWVQSWVYQDQEMNWPRDADRLPNGHTLITDTHSHRVFEIDENGSIVWEITVPFPYDAERLGTGDESAGGPAAQRANLTSVGAATHERGASHDVANEQEESGLWPRIYHGLLFVFPAWVSIVDIILAVELVVVSVGWISMELYWYGMRLRWPVVKE